MRRQTSYLLSIISKIEKSTLTFKLSKWEISAVKSKIIYMLPRCNFITEPINTLLMTASDIKNIKKNIHYCTIVFTALTI